MLVASSRVVKHRFFEGGNEEEGREEKRRGQREEGKKGRRKVGGPVSSKSEREGSVRNQEKPEKP